MSEELEERLYWGGNQRIQAVLQEMFPDSLADEKNGIVEKLTVAYHNYKQRYVKHLSFVPEGDILSERKPNSVMVYKSGWKPDLSLVFYFFHFLLLP